MESSRGNPFLENIKINSYRGIDIRLGGDVVLGDQTAVSSFLDVLMKEAREKHRAVSVSIFLNYLHSWVIPSLVAKGFYIHHAKDDRIVLHKWIDSSRVNKIPQHPRHQIGIGAILLTPEFKFILVKEKTSFDRKSLPLWKFVTGLSEGLEGLHQATAREVSEEVGLKEKDLELCGIAYITHIYPIKGSLHDICFWYLCLLRREVGEDQLKADTSEISQIGVFSIGEVKSMIKTKEMTYMTKKVFDKLLEHIDESKSFEYNRKALSSRVHRQISSNFLGKFNVKADLYTNF